jgi:hypothetical protein
MDRRPSLSNVCDRCMGFVKSSGSTLDAHARRLNWTNF